MSDKCTHPDGHDFDITIWDDGERDCRVCIKCGVERIFVHDAPEGIQDVAYEQGYYSAVFNRDPDSPHLCPHCGSEMKLVQFIPGGRYHWTCEDWQCEDRREGGE